MTRSMYIGDENGKARKVKALYFGAENNKALKIKRMYIGDENSKARLFWDDIKHIATITGTGNSTYSYVEINGSTYTAAATLNLEPGTTVLCHVLGNDGTYAGIITHNGTRVAASSSTSTPAEYSFTVSKDTAIALTYTKATTLASFGTITITEK